MTVLAVYTTPSGKEDSPCNGPVVRKFGNERQAFCSSNGFVLVKSGEDLYAKTQVQIKHLVVAYNKLVPEEEQVETFKNRMQGCLWLVDKANEVLPVEGGETPDLDETARKGHRGKKRGANRRGKEKKQREGRPMKHTFTGKYIFPSERVAEKNPHKVPTAQNYITIEIVRENPGISYEDFIEKGGVLRVLKNAVRDGRLQLSDTP